MSIDKDLLLLDIKNWIPESNELTDDKMIWALNTVIGKYGDEDEVYKEVLCRSLRFIAELNSSNTTVDPEDIRSEKLGSLTNTYYRSGNNKGSVNDTWTIWIKKKLISEYCLLIGWQFPHIPIGIHINPGEVYLTPVEEFCVGAMNEEGEVAINELRL